MIVSFFFHACIIISSLLPPWPPLHELKKTKTKKPVTWGSLYGHCTCSACLWAEGKNECGPSTNALYCPREPLVVHSCKSEYSSHTRILSLEMDEPRKAKAREGQNGIFVENFCLQGWVCGTQRLQGWCQWSETGWMKGAHSHCTPQDVVPQPSAEPVPALVCVSNGASFLLSTPIN